MGLLSLFIVTGTAVSNGIVHKAASASLSTLQGSHNEIARDLPKNPSSIDSLRGERSVGDTSPVDVVVVGGFWRRRRSLGGKEEEDGSSSRGREGNVSG